LLHPIFIIFATWSFVKLAEATGMKVVKSPSEQIPYPGFQFVILNGTQTTLWLSLVYVSFVSNILVWPCAHGLKKLPVFRAVL